MPSEKVKAKKGVYLDRVEQLFAQFRRVLVVSKDSVPSKMMQQTRHALAGKAVLLNGKNSLVRVALARVKNVPGIDILMRAIKQNICLIFTNLELRALRDIVTANKVPGPAKVGQIAPCDVFIPKGNTGLEPTQTSFLQALNIATKINKGTIEILNDVHLIQKGTKVGGSECTLLAKLNMMPFFFEMIPQCFFEEGNVFPASVLEIADEDLVKAFGEACGNVSALSLGSGLPTAASIPYLMSQAFRNLASLGFGAEFKFAQIEALSAAGPAAAATTTTTEAAPEEEKAEEKKEEAEAEPEEEMALDSLFG